MEFYYRKLLLVNEDAPFSSSLTPLPHIQDTEPTATTPESTTSFKRSLQFPQRPVLNSNVVYTFVILFTALFFFAFILLSIRRFSFFRRRRQEEDLAGAGKSLPVSSYSGETKQVECVICLEEFRDSDMVKMLPYCRHVFHPECIDTWLSSHVTCPVCRCSKPCGEIRDVGGSTVENGGEGGEVGSEH